MAPVEYNSTAEEITKNALRRLLHRAGVKRVNSAVYEELRAILSVKLEQVMDVIVTMTEMNGRKTIQEVDIYDAAKELGTALVAGLNRKAKHTNNLRKCAPEPKGKTGTRRHNPGTIAMKKIKKYQKESDCLLIPKQNFKRFVVTLAKQLGGDEIRFQKDVILLIQLWVESFIVELCHDAYLLSTHAGRDTLYPKDIQLVRLITKER